MKKILFLFVFLLPALVTVSGQIGIDQKVEELMAKMTLEEKIGQLTLYTSGWDQTGPTLRAEYKEDIRSGRCGNIFNAHGAAYNRDLQRIAVEETRLGIPLLFGYDVIHGFKTIFPIPIGEACSWDLELIGRSARLASREATAAGLHWTFNPMVDISRDPRWGRVAEGAGEDPYLASLIAVAKVQGHQGEDLSSISTMLACVKHFAAYGAAQAGRDYHTVDMSERVLREEYLPPFKATVDAGVATIMTAFNEILGVPSTGSEFLLKEILREEWGFEGFVVTDYGSINELVPHGFARDAKHAAELAFTAGVDMDMQAAAYQNYLKELLKGGKVSEKDIDTSVRRILEYKFKLGLFDDPYRYSDTEREKEVLFSEELMQHSRDAGRKSMVLLKNDPVGEAALLPLSRSFKKIALIGPLADNPVDQLGSWHAAGGYTGKAVTVLQAMKQALPEAEILYAKGCATTGVDKSGFDEALDAAREAEVVVMAIGENYQQSGEAASRTELGLPGPQQELLEAVYALGKPVVAVIMAGRPLTINWMEENIPAILYAWQPGIMAGPALMDVLLGDYNPSGKLVMTFPRKVGQIPIYYAMKNTGRPFSPTDKYTSKYIDVPNEPLYPFGYGLSYTAFEYSEPRLNKQDIAFGETLEVSVDLRNTGEVAGEEVVQLYVRDLVGSVTRPVKELKGFQKVALEPGATRTITFSLSSDELRFYNQDMEFVAEPGQFNVWVGGSSDTDNMASFNLTE